MRSPSTARLRPPRPRAAPQGSNLGRAPRQSRARAAAQGRGARRKAVSGELSRGAPKPRQAGAEASWRLPGGRSLWWLRGRCMV